MADLETVRDQAHALYRAKSRSTGKESAVERIALATCGDASLWEVMEWPAVTKIRSQVQLGKSRADIVLEHIDRSVTLIEVKPAGLTLREYCTGIGQLSYQAIMAISVYQTLTVRRVLCLPAPVPPDLFLAASFSDVDLLPVAAPEKWDSWIDEARPAHQALS